MTSKAVMETMIKISVMRLRGNKIIENCMVLGPMAIEMFFAGKSDALIERIAKEVPLERLGEVADVAPVVAFLAGDEGEWIKARVFIVNGGTPLLRHQVRLGFYLKSLIRFSFMWIRVYREILRKHLRVSYARYLMQGAKENAQL